jgi:uncharacterized YccA/Bax inhibitor family protein
MGLLQMGVQAVTRRLPKSIPVKTHAVVDYAVAGSFLAAAAFLWSRNRRAATAALVCGSAGVANALLTDYPGGVFKVIPFSRHQHIEKAMAGVLATIPGIAGFKEDRISYLFRGHSLGLAALTGITDFDEADRSLDRPWAA